MASSKLTKWKATRNIAFQGFSVSVGDEFEIVDHLDDDRVIIRKNNQEAITSLGVVESAAIRIK